MTKIVINSCYGGFGLSPLATTKYLELKGKKCYFYITSDYGDYSYDSCTYKRLSIEEATKEHTVYTILQDLGEFHKGRIPNDVFFSDYNIERNDPDLIKVVEEFGEKANDTYSKLEIVEIPDDVKSWEIEDYDGRESVHETHRSWC